MGRGEHQPIEASLGDAVGWGYRCSYARVRKDLTGRLRGGRTVLKTNGSEPITADITNARAILLRITCSTSTLTVTFIDPRIGR